MTCDDSRLIESVILPIKLTNGNEGRQKSWYKPARVRQQFESLLLAMHRRRVPHPCKVSVVVTRILGPGEQAWDSSSILRGNYKELEDALVATGWFVDDSPRWIVETLGRQDSSRRDIGPAVELSIYRASIAAA